MKTRVFRVYGCLGHRQRESFCRSYIYDFSKNGRVRILDVRNSDKTGTNAYTEVAVTCDTAEECASEISGQITDGIFENSNTGKVTEVFPDGEEKEPVWLW